MSAVGLFIVFIDRLAMILSLLIFIRVLISWFPQIQHGRIVQLIYDMTEPVMSLARRFPHRFGMVDFSPVIAMLLVEGASRFLFYLLSSFLS